MGRQKSDVEGRLRLAETQITELANSIHQKDAELQVLASESVRYRHFSGVTSHRQPRQCWGPKTVKGAQSDPNYVSRLLLDSVPVFHKM